MKFWKILLPVLAVAVIAGPGCTTSGKPEAKPQAALAVPPQLLQQTNLYEIVRHLYRWYWEEGEIERAADLQDWVFWVRPVSAKLDPGDKSKFAEILLPQLGTVVHLKETDYTIEEMKIQVKSQDFHIKSVSKTTIPPQPPADCAVVKIKADELKEFLYRTRSQPDYPSPELFERMRGALRKELEKEASMSTNPPVGEQVVYVAPLSPVGNDIWVFWENRKLLIRFASDIDLTNPAVWDQETLMVHVYDPYHQMVLSPDQAQASNRFMTRYEIGRALYNCVVLGQRVAVTARK